MELHIAQGTRAFAPLHLPRLAASLPTALSAGSASLFDPQLSPGQAVLQQPGGRGRSNLPLATPLFILVGLVHLLVLLGFNSAFDLTPTQVTPQIGKEDR